MVEMEGYLEDPELGDENDPEYRQGMFAQLKSLGASPKDIQGDAKFKKGTPHG